MLDTDEIRAKLEEVYDAVQVKLKETEGTDDEADWQEVEFHLDRAFGALDAIERCRRILNPDPDLSIPVEGD